MKKGLVLSTLMLALPALAWAKGPVVSGTWSLVNPLFDAILAVILP